MTTSEIRKALITAIVNAYEFEFHRPVTPPTDHIADKPAVIQAFDRLEEIAARERVTYNAADLMQRAREAYCATFEGKYDRFGFSRAEIISGAVDDSWYMQAIVAALRTAGPRPAMTEDEMLQRARIAFAEAAGVPDALTGHRDETKAMKALLYALGNIDKPLPAPPPTVDPLLLKAREIVAEHQERVGNYPAAQDTRDGKRDGPPYHYVSLVLTALKADR